MAQATIPSHFVCRLGFGECGLEQGFLGHSDARHVATQVAEQLHAGCDGSRLQRSHPSLRLQGNVNLRVNGLLRVNGGGVRRLSLFTALASGLRWSRRWLCKDRRTDAAVGVRVRPAKRNFRKPIGCWSCSNSSFSDFNNSSARCTWRPHTWPIKEMEMDLLFCMRRRQDFSVRRVRRDDRPDRRSSTLLDN